MIDDDDYDDIEDEDDDDGYLERGVHVVEVGHHSVEVDRGPHLGGAHPVLHGRMHHAPFIPTFIPLLISTMKTRYPMIKSLQNERCRSLDYMKRCNIASNTFEK